SCQSTARKPGPGENWIQRHGFAWRISSTSEPSLQEVPSTATSRCAILPRAGTPIPSAPREPILSDSPSSQTFALHRPTAPSVSSVQKNNLLHCPPKSRLRQPPLSKNPTHYLDSRVPVEGQEVDDMRSLLLGGH